MAVATGIVQVGDKHVYGVTNQTIADELPILITFYKRGTNTVAAANAVIQLTQAQLSPFGKMAESPGSNGQTCNRTTYDEGVELQLECVPAGTTVAYAVTGLYIPPPLSYAKIAQAPVVGFGCFDSDVFNSSDWQVQAATATMVADGKAGISVTLRRYAALNTKMANPVPPA